MSDAGQVTGSAAEVYEEFFVPALFGPWATRVVRATGIEEGMRVVDVACGTGALAIVAASVAGSNGHVIGIDCNEGMLAIARRKSSDVEWQQAAAERLPLEDDSQDAVVSQFGLMFFEDRVTSIREMWRVLKPGGRLGVAVWDSLDRTPGYAAIVALLARMFGSETADLLRAPYSLGNPETLSSLLTEAGVESFAVRTEHGVASFESIRAWMHTDVRGWTLGGRIDHAQFEGLVREAEQELRGFARADGTVEFPHPAILVTAMKPTL